MDGTQVGVLKEPNKVCLGSLLQRKHSMALETEVTTKKSTQYLEILSNFTNQPLEWKLPDKKLSTLLVFPNLTVSITNFIIRYI
uniref:Uncharacterized protein n=1 Tax=Cajanus cajan TaxID=3821 RepID=A0A151U8Z5_CAJCA|nr:hypothetical protein KK1_019974 [Cajanus cajan]